MSAFAPPPPFSLSEDDRHNPLWLRLRSHLTEELDAARGRNDRPLSETETAAIRGEIRTLKRIVALGDDRPELTGNEDQPP